MRSLKWPQVTENLLGVSLDGSEDTVQRCHDFLVVFEATIVRAMNARMMPQRLGGVEFG